MSSPWGLWRETTYSCEGSVAPASPHLPHDKFWKLPGHFLLLSWAVLATRMLRELTGQMLKGREGGDLCLESHFLSPSWMAKLSGVCEHCHKNCSNNCTFVRSSAHLHVVCALGSFYPRSRKRHTRVFCRQRLA